MTNAARRLEAKVLGLPPEERARLAERLLSSLDDATDVDAEQRWIEEAERRLDEVSSGLVKSKPAEDVLDKARSALR